MGYRNHLHICQHCGVVHATASTVGPSRCMVCSERNFSEYVPTNTVTWKLYSDFKRLVGERSVRVDLDDNGDLSAGIHVLLNHEDVQAADGLETMVHTGDELGLFTAFGTFAEAADADAVRATRQG